MAGITALLWALHPLDSYGIYEAVYGRLSEFEAADVGQAGAAVLPDWVAERGSHENLAFGLGQVAWDEDAAAAFVAQAASWTAEERERAIATMRLWAEEEPGWQDILTELGAEIEPVPLDPIPDSWPAEWIRAVEEFRAEGSLTLLWRPIETAPADFGPLLAALQLDHGEDWREVRRLITPLSVRRPDVIPEFLAAVAELPGEQQQRVSEVLGRIEPNTLAQLAKRHRDYLEAKHQR